MSALLLSLVSPRGSSQLPGDVQAENAALQVRVGSMEEEMQEESLRMQELLQQNAQLELEKEKT